MNKSEFSRNIADSLTVGSWTQEFITINLLRRFPYVLHRLVPEIVAELFLALPSQYAPSANSVASSLLHIHNFERAFRFCQKRDIWPARDLTSPVMSPISAFTDLDVPQLPTVGSLAEWLLLPTARLEYLADRHRRYEEHGETAVNHYHYHYLIKKKKTKGIRVIEAPKQNLKAVQRQIHHDIISKLQSHTDAFGFVKGRNCLQAASRHVGEDVVVCFDLRDFFPSIGAGRIFGLFRCLGYPHEVAQYLTALCTTSTPPRILERLNFDDRSSYRKPHLPQGSPVSPALANHVSFTLDRRLSALANSLGAHYSRYADDLSFSGDKHIVGSLLRIVPQIVRDEGFAINRAKTRLMSNTSRQMVTGVVVNERLNIDRKLFDHLKAVIHACGKPDDTRLLNPVFRASLLGKINWVEAVNPSRGLKLQRLLKRADL